MPAYTQTPVRNLIVFRELELKKQVTRETWIGKNVQVHAAAFGQSGPEYATLPLHVRGNTFPNPKGYVTMHRKAMTTAKALPPIGKVAAGCPPSWFGGVSRDMSSTTQSDYINPLSKLTVRP